MNTENNKIIAEFMGFLTPENNITIWKDAPKYVNELTRLEDAKYHSDWNWLMEVVEKIDNSKRYTESKEYRNFHLLKITDNMQQVYFTCLQFIKWYNENAAKKDK